MTSAEPDKRLEIVFAEALRAVTHQQSVMDGIRTRATTLTAAAALVTPFFGTPVLQARDRAGWPTIVALAALTGVLASTFVVSAPWWRWTFRASAAALLQAVDAGHGVDSTTASAVVGASGSTARTTNPPPAAAPVVT